MQELRDPLGNKGLQATYWNNTKMEGTPAAVTRIEGSYFNVMGLPIQRLYTELKSF